MKISNKILSALIAFGSLSFYSCSKDEVSIELSFDFEVPSEGFVFTAEETESRTIEFVANQEWRATTNAGWISITPTTGSGEGVITVTVLENTTFEQRDGEISVRDIATSTVKTVKVTQGAKGQSMVFSKDIAQLKFSEKALSDTVSVTGNFSWDISQTPEWISYEYISSENGSLTRTVVLYADMSKLTQYESEGTILFKDNGNRLEDVSYSVFYPGFTPATSFQAGIGFDLVDVENNRFELAGSGENEIKSRLNITANYEFEFVNIDERISAITEIYENEKVQNGFVSTKQYFVDFNTDYLDTESIELNFTIKAKNLEDIKDVELTAIVNGVGENFVYADFSKFQRNDMGYFNFEAGSRNQLTWEVEGYLADTLAITTSETLSNDESQWPFSILVADCRYGIISKPYTPILNRWVYIDRIVDNTRAAIQNNYFEISVGVRGENMMSDYYPAQQREFAVLVIPAVDGYQLTIDDIFDADDNLKPEYEGYCQYFTQDGKVEKYDFVCPDMPTNKMWITATQEIAEITLFAENVFEPLAISFFYNYFVEGNDMFGDPVGSAIDPIVETVDMSFDYATFEYKVKLYFKANTTSEERSRTYGFGIFSETSGSESYLPAYGFEIVQSANIE